MEDKKMLDILAGFEKASKGQRPVDKSAKQKLMADNDMIAIMESFNSVSEGKKQKPADQVKGNEPMPDAKAGRTEHPFTGKLVGENQEVEEVASVESFSTILQNEDLVTDLKNKFADFLKGVGDSVDDKELVVPQDDTVKTYQTDDGHTVSIHGNQGDGFRIKIDAKPSNSKFNNLEEAELAAGMFMEKRAKQLVDPNDYAEEA